MNNVTPKTNAEAPAAGAARVRSPTRRALAKQQTRAKILEAARQQFSEKGYYGATVRDIAAAAGMSTGAVFANFADKGDLFREMFVEDIEIVHGRMREAAVAAASVEEALVGVFMAGYAFYQPKMMLARAAFVSAWAEDSAHRRKAMELLPMPVILAEQLDVAVARGELRGDADLKLRATMLFDCYLSNFQPAIFDDWTLDELKARSRAQVDIVLAGARTA